MCGIFGVVRFGGESARDDRIRVDGSLERLRTRGPDDVGAWQDDGAVLGVTRLAMSDPAGGRQPMASHDGSLVVGFNGEVYDSARLRFGLAGRGYRFRTTSDTETLTALLHADGVRGLRDIDAQYSIAYWDRRDRSISLVRDRFGIHPLYYAALDDGVVFGSSAGLVGLFAGRTQPNISALYGSLVAGGIPSPHSTYEGVFQVPPGYVVRITAAGEQTRPVDPLTLPAAGDEDRTIDDDDLREAFDRAVADRCQADAPLGLLLSSGVDSGAVAASAARAGWSLPAYTLRSAAGALDESGAATHLAGRCGHTSRVVAVDGGMLAGRVLGAIADYDEPIWRTGPIGFDLLAERVAGDGVKGLLTGDGADELFCGYDVFKHTLIRRAIGRRSSPARVRLFEHVDSTAGMATGDAPPAAMAPFAYEPDDLVYSHLPRWRMAAGRASALLAPDLRKAHSIDTFVDGVREAYGDELAPLSPLNRARHLEINTVFSPFLISMQGDRPFLRHGVEGRHPFLSRRVTDLALRTDPLRMVTTRHDKIPLRRALAPAFDPEMSNAPKHAYEPGWVALRDAEPFRELCATVLSPVALGDGGMFDADRVARLSALALSTGHARIGTFTTLLQVLTIQVLIDRG